MSVSYDSAATRSALGTITMSEASRPASMSAVRSDTYAVHAAYQASPTESYTVMGASAIHVIHCEINAVTSAMRKHARNVASSSFLGSASNASGAAVASGPIPSGSTAASLLKSTNLSVAAAGLPSTAHSTASPRPSSNGKASADRQRGAYSGPARDGEEDRSSHDATSADTLSHYHTTVDSVAEQLSRPHYTYADGRVDDTLPSLLHGFSILRAQLRDNPDIASFPLPFLVLPFLRVILSSKTTGPVTSIALQAIHRLITYGVVRLPARESRADEIIASRSEQRDGMAYLYLSSAHLAIAEIAHAVSHCRFEASEAVADELVLLRILAVMRELISGDNFVPVATFASSGQDNLRQRGPQSGFSALADCLGDESICEMMETGLSMCCQMRLSDLLRRTAEQSVTTMVRALFSRLATLPLASDDAYSGDPNVPDVEPEHATLAAEPVGDDTLDLDREKRLRRMTMPDPQSLDIPAAANGVPALQDLKAMGEQEAAEQPREINEDDPDAGKIATQETEKETPISDAQTQAVDAKGATPATGRIDGIIDVETRPFGLPAIKEVLRVIVSLLDPRNAHHTDSMRLLGLNILGAVLEVAGHYVGKFPSLRVIIQDSACKHIFALIRSDVTQIEAAALRTLTTLFETMRPHLKLQYELFLSYLTDRLAPTFPISAEPWRDETFNIIAARRGVALDPQARLNGTESPGSPRVPPAPPLPRSSDRAPAHGEGRELTIETLSLLLGTSSPRSDGVDSLTELWINYDCDVDCDNMFEKFIAFLCRAVYASNPLHPQIQESTQLFAIDTLLNFIGNMAARQESAVVDSYSEPQWPPHLPQPDVLTGHKNTKASLLLGADKFNAKPKEGLAYFVQNAFIEEGVSQEGRDVNVARFLKGCPRLDKKVLGDYLSRPDNEAILKAFLGFFDFSGTPIAEAMREMLEAFRLPGESQQIARITETFAKIYFASQPIGINSEDAVYVLSYSVIMLNTDLHNPQNKRRMTVDDYRRNLRGVNDGKDFDPEFLGAIYDSIRRREIVMPEEHKGQLGFDYTWKELLRRSRRAGDLLCPPTNQFDRAMFESSWRPIVASIAYAFSSYRDEHIIERSISGFRQCALLAGRFGMHELFDFMIRALAGATGLLDSNGAGVVSNNAVVDVENQQITISPLSVQFGRNFKGQLAAVVLFTIANGNGDAVRSSWLPIFEIFKNLFINTLLAPAIGLMFEFGSEADLKPIPLKAKRPPGPLPQDPRSNSGTGLFSTISSYLLSPYTTEREVSRPDISIDEEAVESSLCTVDCVASCRIEDLYAELMMLGQEARLAAVDALMTLARRYTTERQARPFNDFHGPVDASSGRSTPIQGSSIPLQRPAPSTQYDAGAAFALELAANIACSAESVEFSRIWVTMSGYLSDLLGAPDQFHALQIERAIVAMLRLIKHAAHTDSLRDQAYMLLDRVTGLPAEVRLPVAHQITAGLYEIIASTPGFAKSRTEWTLVYSLLSMYGSTRSATAVRFSIRAVQAIVQSKSAESSLVTQESFAGLLTILRDFAEGAEMTGRQDTDSPRPDSAQRKTLTEKKAIEEFREACSERGPVAVGLLEAIRVHVPSIVLSSSSPTIESAWESYWLPLMTAIARQYVNGHRPTRQAALISLPRILLTPELLQQHPDVASPSSDAVFGVLQSLFQDVLFPTLHELLKPEVFQMDPSSEAGSMQETRMRACNLLCKVFLHYLGRLASLPAAGPQASDVHIDERFMRLWLAVLDFFDRFMHSARGDALTEATAENLKNVLLVMNASGLLEQPATNAVEPAAAEGDLNANAEASLLPVIQDPRTPGQRQLFDQTFERIHRFMPNLQAEIFQRPVEEARAAPAA